MSIVDEIVRRADFYNAAGRMSTRCADATSVALPCADFDRLVGVVRNREEQAREESLQIDDDDEYEAVIARDEAIDAALVSGDLPALDAALSES